MSYDYEDQDDREENDNEIKNFVVIGKECPSCPDTILSSFHTKHAAEKFADTYIENDSGVTETYIARIVMKIEVERSINKIVFLEPEEDQK